MLYPCKHDFLYLTAVQHQPSPVSMVLVAYQTPIFCDSSRWEQKCANLEFPFIRTLEKDEYENLRQKSLKIMHQCLLCAASFTLTSFYHPFVSSEPNVMFPSGYFDCRRNQAWKNSYNLIKLLLNWGGGSLKS